MPGPRILIMIVRLLVVLVSLLPAAAAQLAQPGFRDEVFQNSTGSGSSQLRARVYYPATTAGYNAPLLALPGGYPVIVFQHGFGLPGSAYGLFGQELSSRGYVVVQGETAVTSSSLQVLDGLAMFPTLEAVNQEPGHFLQGALDMARAGICGHSMGGGNSFAVLARNPGYLLGLGIAPTYPGASVMNAVRVPVGVIHGEGDVVTPVGIHGARVYSAATSYDRVKFFYRFNLFGTHTNVAGFPVTPIGGEIWQRTVQVTAGFFDRFLRARPAGMEEVVGPTALSERYLSALQVEVGVPDAWVTPSATIGQSSRIEVLGEPGPAALLAAAATTSLATPFGVLRLDPLTIVVASQGAAGGERLFTTTLPIPNDPGLVGVKVPFQAVGLERAGQLRFSDLLTIGIGP